MYAVYLLTGQATASQNAPHSSEILEEMNFSLFLSSNFKMNGQFGFGANFHNNFNASTYDTINNKTHLNDFLIE